MLTAATNTTLAQSEVRQADLLEQSQEAMEESPQWVVTLIGVVITGCVGPVIVGHFKSKADRSDRNLNYAWEEARNTKKELLDSKDRTIQSLQAEVARLLTSETKLRDMVDHAQDLTRDAEKAAYQAEQLLMICKRDLDFLEQKPDFRTD